MKISIDYDGRNWGNSLTVAEAHEAEIPTEAINIAAKVAAKAEIAAFANAYRARISSTSAGKLAAYKMKEEVARDPDNAAPAEIALLDREATARGVSRDALIASILVQASAYRQIALLIEVLEAETGAAIGSISNDAPDIELEITTVLGAAKVQAETAFQEAISLIGSS